MTETKPKDPKERILASALALFDAKGYAGAGVREIAGKAGVNIAMINYYFGSKQGILETLVSQFFDGYAGAINLALTEPGSLDEILHRLVREIAGYFRDNQEHLRIFLMEFPHDIPEFAQFKADKLQSILHRVLPAVLSKASQINPHLPPPFILGPAMVGMLSAHFLLKPVIEPAFGVQFDEAFYERYPEYIAGMFLNGIKNIGPIEVPALSRTPTDDEEEDSS